MYRYVNLCHEFHLFCLDLNDDFLEPANLDVVFPEGSTNGPGPCINIPIIDDFDFELVQMINVDMTTISPPIIPGSGVMAQVEISDNDGKPLAHPSSYTHSCTLCLSVYSSNGLKNKPHGLWY